MPKETNVILEKLLKQAIINFKLELADINTNIEVLKKLMLPIKTNLLASVQELQKVCIHEKLHRVNGTYYPAGYDYYSESNYTIVCDNCDKVLESKCIRGSHFG